LASGTSYSSIRTITFSPKCFSKSSDSSCKLLVSVSGGVRAVSRLAAEPSHLVKSTLQSEEKQVIGALAASLIAKNSCIYLDAGTTTLALARAILDRDDLQVVTNDFEITQLLIDASAG
jgi:DeoR/GlpR family transcriptional regulator of sugar metabolism